MSEWFACPAKDGLVGSLSSHGITQMHIRVLLNIERGTVVKNRSLNARSYRCDYGHTNSS